jgi:hypothetical protein
MVNDPWEALRSKAETDLEILIEDMSDAASKGYVGPSTFQAAKVAIETLAPDASDKQVMEWTKALLAVAAASSGEVRAHATALAYRLIRLN